MPKTAIRHRPPLPDSAYADVNLLAELDVDTYAFGCLNEAADSDTRWYAFADLSGIRVAVEGRTSAPSALDALVLRLLTGARCECGKLVAFADDGAYAYSRAVLSDGSEWTLPAAAAAGQCRWRRVGTRWHSACESEGK